MSRFDALQRVCSSPSTAAPAGLSACCELADTGRPLNFLDVAVPVHLAFYRAGIAAITDGNGATLNHDGYTNLEVYLNDLADEREDR